MPDKRFTLRFDEDIFNIAQRIALINHRSVAKEIEFALNRYYLTKPLIDKIFEDITPELLSKNINETNFSEVMTDTLLPIIQNYTEYRKNPSNTKV